MKKKPTPCVKTHLSIAEAAEMIGVSKTFIRREIWADRIIAARFGSRVCIPISEFDRFCAAALLLPRTEYKKPEVEK